MLLESSQEAQLLCAAARFLISPEQLAYGCLAGWLVRRMTRCQPFTGFRLPADTCAGPGAAAGSTSRSDAGLIPRWELLRLLSNTGARCHTSNHVPSLGV